MACEEWYNKNKNELNEYFCQLLFYIIVINYGWLEYLTLIIKPIWLKTQLSREKMGKERV